MTFVELRTMNRLRERHAVISPKPVTLHTTTVRKQSSNSEPNWTAWRTAAGWTWSYRPWRRSSKHATLCELPSPAQTRRSRDESHPFAGGVAKVSARGPGHPKPARTLQVRLPDLDWSGRVGTATDLTEQTRIKRNRRGGRSGRGRCLRLLLLIDGSLLMRHVRLLGWGRTPCACASIPAATLRPRNCQLLQVIFNE